MPQRDTVPARDALRTGTEGWGKARKRRQQVFHRGLQGDVGASLQQHHHRQDGEGFRDRGDLKD